MMINVCLVINQHVNLEIAISQLTENNYPKVHRPLQEEDVVVVIYGSWTYNYLRNQCISSLPLDVRIQIMTKCTRYNIM